MIKKLINYLTSNIYPVFLGTLVFWIGVLPILEFTGLILIIENILLLLISISSFIFFKKENNKLITYFLIPVVLVVNFVASFYGEVELDKIGRLIFLILLFFITLGFFKKIIRHKKVDFDLIYIAIATYILLAMMSSILCWFVFYLYPGSYNLNSDFGSPIIDFIYYCIVTMSTLGYGDIVPLLPQSRALAILITLTGQFYMAILVAFLVGKFLNQKSTN